MRNYLFFVFMFVACKEKINPVPDQGHKDSNIFTEFTDTTDHAKSGDSTLAEKIVAFAKTQIGVPYKYCSMDPQGGFDCSGFVNYVFNHFSIKVPRSSVDFTNAGEDVPFEQASMGDLILFTGTDPRKRSVGHIGIIVENNHGNIRFIQSTSGEAYGVTISPLDQHYMSRFVKVIRIK